MKNNLKQPSKLNINHAILKSIICSLFTTLATIIIFNPVDFAIDSNNQNLLFNAIKVFNNILERATAGAPRALAILLPVLYFWYYKFFKLYYKATWHVKIPSFLISFALLLNIDYLSIAAMFNLYNILSFHFIFETFAFIGIYIFIKSIIVRLFYYFDGLQLKKYNIENKAISNKLYYLFCFCIILLSWSPYLIMQYPGSLPADTGLQVSEHLGIYNYNAANPLLTTLIFGSLFKLGRLLNDNFGLFLTVSFQTLACVAAFSLLCLRIKNMALPKYFSYISLALYVLTPIWASFVQCLLKDVLHTAAFTWFLIEFCDSLLSIKPNKSLIIRLLLSAILASLTRAVGTYIVIACLFVLFILKAKYSFKSFGLITIVISIVCLSASPVLTSLLKAEKRGHTDTLGLMFQQTAYYCISYSDEITQEEKDIINGALNYDIITSKYSPTLSDKVKGTFHYEKEAFIKYAKLWLNHFSKHPGTYLTAFINSNNGYWQAFFPFRMVTLNNIDNEFEHNIHYVNSINKRQIIDYYIGVWRMFPGVSLLFSACTYFYLLLISLFYSIKNKNKNSIAVAMLGVFVFLGCLLSPVNGEFRYIAPLIATIPFIFSFSVQNRI